MEAIYGPHGIKTIGPNKTGGRMMRDVADKLVLAGAQAVIAGCTEVSVGLSCSGLTVPLLDPLEILAVALVREGLGRHGSEQPDVVRRKE